MALSTLILIKDKKMPQGPELRSQEADVVSDND